MLFIVAVYYIPESPIYLMSKGRVKEAEAALTQLDIDLSVLATVSNNEDESKLSQIKKPANLKPFLTGIILMAFFQGILSTS